MRSVGILCARAASKRLPRKHLRALRGLPLVAWMCRAAAASQLTRAVMTTEDDEIASIAVENGVDAPFRRPAPESSPLTIPLHGRCPAFASSSPLPTCPNPCRASGRSSATAP